MNLVPVNSLCGASSIEVCRRFSPNLRSPIFLFLQLFKLVPIQALNDVSDSTLGIQLKKILRDLQIKGGIILVLIKASFDFGTSKTSIFDSWVDDILGILLIVLV